jgi:hypothetical protein
MGVVSTSPERPKPRVCGVKRSELNRGAVSKVSYLATVSTSIISV